MGHSSRLSPRVTPPEEIRNRRGIQVSTEELGCPIKMLQRAEQRLIRVPPELCGMNELCTNVSSGSPSRVVVLARQHQADVRLLAASLTHTLAEHCVQPELSKTRDVQALCCVGFQRPGPLVNDSYCSYQGGR